MSDTEVKEEKKTWYQVFFKDHEQQALIEWSQWLDDNRGERAQLRRCEKPQDVLIQSGFHRLCKKLPNWEREDLLALAMLAGLASHIKESISGSLATQLGKAKEGGDKPVMSEMRFQQLLSSDNAEALYDRLRRAIQLLRGKIDIVSLADGVFHWSRDQTDAYQELPSQRFQFVWSKAYYSEVFKYQKEK